MDLAFTRYANPYILFDSMIASGEFFEFVKTLYKQKEEEQLFEVWLHKVYDMDWKEYLDKIIGPEENIDVGQIVEGTNDVLNAITPS